MCASCLALTAVAQAESTSEPGDDALARSIVEKADRIRFPDAPFEVNVAIQVTSGGNVTETRGYQILSKGNENTIVIATGRMRETRVSPI